MRFMGIAKDPVLLHVDSQDSDQTGRTDRSLRWSHMSVYWFCRASVYMILYFMYDKKNAIECKVFSRISWEIKNAAPYGSERSCSLISK